MNLIAINTNKKSELQKKADKTAQMLVDNLNLNVKLDHIDFVDHGIRPMDDDYHIFKKEMIELLGQEKFDEKMKHRASAYKRDS